MIVHVRLEVDVGDRQPHDAIEVACTALRQRGHIVRAGEFHVVPTDWTGEPIYEHDHDHN